MPTPPKKPAKKKVADRTATERQQRRRQTLREAGAQTVDVLLSNVQGKRLDALLADGYASDKSAVLAKGLDEAYERHAVTQPRTPRKSSI